MNNATLKYENVKKGIWNCASNERREKFHVCDFKRTICEAQKVLQAHKAQIKSLITSALVPYHLMRQQKLRLRFNVIKNWEKPRKDHKRIKM